MEAPEAAIVFCRTRGEVDQLTETLNGRGYRAEALHGGMDQDQRERVLGRLRSGTTELLVATDGTAPISKRCPLARSMLASRRRSRGSTNVMATPSRPARPTRPMRCTNESGADGTS
ncbi:MAG TPA: helicase-related protein [Acidimicrobiales bacterium]|nr:helicase-related protein [Acidimicrobiales bacterium]